MEVYELIYRPTKAAAEFCMHFEAHSKDLTTVPLEMRSYPHLDILVEPLNNWNPVFLE